MNHLRIGRWSVIIGVLFTIIGLVGGFGVMFAGAQGKVLNLLALAPVGMVLAFFGATLVVLTEPRSVAPPTEPTPPPAPDPCEPGETKS